MVRPFQAIGKAADGTQTLADDAKPKAAFQGEAPPANVESANEPEVKPLEPFWRWASRLFKRQPAARPRGARAVP